MKMSYYVIDGTWVDLFDGILFWRMVFWNLDIILHVLSTTDVYLMRLSL